MADSGDIGNETCLSCGAIYCRFISKSCPVCNLRDKKNTDFLLGKYMESTNKSKGWNGDV